jgi:transglutaminase-like putative cysteine protease
VDIVEKNTESIAYPVKVYNVETCLRHVSTLKPVYTCRSVPFVFALIILLFLSCSSDHLITNNNYLGLTENAFNQRKQTAVGRDSALLTVFRQNLSIKQTEALKFLYAYMPLSDLADYNGDFFLANVNVSLKTRSLAKWGKDIPEEIFLHYVLPPRINNENLDSIRINYYAELTERIKGKDLKEAALEINHWCHEKVSYQPSDDRTSAPISTILSARGRCGEESTFTVAALRTVGIPARQVYTPRWAHSDDNHAWVEIWFNGDWYYMGACEPEPVLDRGWFTEPARRAMLVHTKSFGAFNGHENIINKNFFYSDVNNLKKYAVTKKIIVKVLDGSDKPVKNAEVEYQLYNYAEFYPLAVVPTNESGISQFETGLGDLLIWAHKDDNLDFKKISVGETDTLILKLNRQITANDSFDMDLEVPIVRSPFPGPSLEIIDQNSDRIKKENIIRQGYIDSWIKPSEARELAKSLKSDSTKAMNSITRSMGNYKEISEFLTETPDSLLPLAMSLLEILPDKDLRDIKKNVLRDHLYNCRLPNKNVSDNLFSEDILNPRVANEMLVPWRHYFLTKLPSQLVQNGENNPTLIVKYADERTRIEKDENYYGTPLSPIGVHELRIADNASRAIYFVAICRSLGVASRLEPGRKIPQYYFNSKWNDVYFSGQKQPDQNKGFIKLQSSETKPVPEYYINFTLAHFEGGRYNTLEYDFNKMITDFKEELALPPGHYMLVTGNRLSDSRILSNITFFDLLENEHKTIEVKIRKDITEKKTIGKIDLDKIYALAGNSDISQSCTKHNGLVVIWIDPEKEPTKHIFNDLPNLKAELDAWGGNFIFLQQSESFNMKNIKGLPLNSTFGFDNQMTVLKNNLKFNQPTDINLPFVVIADKDGNIYFVSSGYRIGIGEQILKYIR